MALNLSDTQQAWADTSSGKKALIVIIVVVTIGVLAWLLPSGIAALFPSPVVISTTPEHDAKIEAMRADFAALEAMTLEQLRAEVAKREDALKKISPPSGEAYITADDAVTRAREEMNKKQFGGNKQPG